ncbi:MAG TPA: hypothetical protein VJX28_02455 [Chthoniobacterales bacterium]|nr:hypothetical protein [Chthoniobacterales bacterium]
MSEILTSLAFLLFPLSFIPLVLFAEAASRHYSVSRERILSSFSLSLAVLAVLLYVSLGREALVNAVAKLPKV